MLDPMEVMKANILTSDSSRVSLYRSINPTFTLHDIYKAKLINGLERVSWTRFRISADSAWLLRREDGIGEVEVV